MTLQDPHSAGTRAFLVFAGRRCQWALDAERVDEVATKAPAGMDLIPDLESLLALPHTVPVDQGRVLSIHTGQGRCWLRCGSHVSIRELAFTDVCELPAEVRRGLAGRVLAGVVFAERGDPLLVLDIEELGRVSAERRNAATTR